MDDLISKKEVENKILNFGGFNCWDDKSSLMCEISSAPPAFEGMTNGEVIKMLFPYIEVSNYGVVVRVKGLDCDKGALDPYRYFWTDWWNAPYKAESEE